MEQFKLKSYVFSQKQPNVINMSQKMDDSQISFRLRGLRRKTETPSIRPKTILIHRAPQLYHVIHEGKQVTPKPLNPELISGHERHISTIDIRSLSHESTSTGLTGLQTGSVGALRSQVHLLTVEGGTLYLSFQASGSADEFDQMFSGSIVSEDSSLYSPKSYDLSIPQEEQTHISLVLNETCTVFTLDIPSSSSMKDTEEADLIEEQNKVYEYLTEGKGKNRRVTNAETQTVPIFQKTRNTEARLVKTKDNEAFASVWDILDSYKEQENFDIPVADEPDEESDDDFDDDENHKLIEGGSIDSYRTGREEKQLLKLMKSPKFLEAVCVIERILANNCFNEEQKRFRGLVEKDLLRDDVEYNYRLDLLWTFANCHTKGQCVTAMEWNPQNKDLLAVGYGKYYFNDRNGGNVMIWNIKNPVQPERHYIFSNPVTSLGFANSYPNHLAVGFYSGDLIVINIIYRELTIVTSAEKCFEPIWDLYWYQSDSQQKKQEHICACMDDGRIAIFKFTYMPFLKHEQIMRIMKTDGELKGLATMKKCPKISVSVSRNTSGLVMTPHPSKKNLYFVCSSEGVIHKCSMNYYHHHLDLLLAHEGPIYNCTMNPFWNRIGLTCSDDWFIRVWSIDLFRPLVEMTQKMHSVCSVDWSPIHSTILVSVTEANIVIWDLQRKIYEPQSVTKSPAEAKCTKVQFVEDGRCLIVGDIDGNVQVFALEDMPFSPFFQANLLYESLMKALITKPDLSHKLEKLWKSKDIDN